MRENNSLRQANISYFGRLFIVGDNVKLTKSSENNYGLSQFIQLLFSIRWCTQVARRVDLGFINIVDGQHNNNNYWHVACGTLQVDGTCTYGRADLKLPAGSLACHGASLGLLRLGRILLCFITIKKVVEGLKSIEVLFVQLTSDI